MQLRDRVSMRSPLVAVLLAPVVVACGGDDVTRPRGGAGTTSVVLVDPPSPASAREHVHALRSTAFEGTLTGEAEAYLSVDGETWVDIGSVEQVRLRLQSGDSARVTEASVPADTYSHVRIVLRDAVATVQAGAELGGIFVETDLSLQLGGDGEVVVEKQLAPFEVGAGGETRLIVDLNSNAWVTQESAERGSVSEADVAASIRVQVETTAEVS